MISISCSESLCSAGDVCLSFQAAIGIAGKRGTYPTSRPTLAMEHPRTADADAMFCEALGIGCSVDDVEKHVKKTKRRNLLITRIQCHDFSL